LLEPSNVEGDFLQGVGVRRVVEALVSASKR
jgi:hypothetical protein